MRKLILQAILPLACLCSSQIMAKSNKMNDTDILKISHAIDGNISEWKTDRFETDKETQILYSVDHDAINLYVAMKIPDQHTQKKMMMQGMNMYIDTKGKRKKGTGIEFPIGKEAGNDFGSRDRMPGSGEGEKALTKELREKLALTMIFLKTFGFTEQEDQTQLITQPNNGINLAFDWDERNNLQIEYLVPIHLLGSAASLNGRTLGIGWRINGAVASDKNRRPADIAVGVAGIQSSGARAGRGASPQNIIIPGETRGQDYSFWTRYTLNF